MVCQNGFRVVYNVFKFKRNGDFCAIIIFFSAEFDSTLDYYEHPVLKLFLGFVTDAGNDPLFNLDNIYT